MTTTILILAANPPETDRLNLESEQRTIEDIRLKSPLRDTFTITTASAAQWEDLQHHLTTVQARIVHYIGHGEGDKGLMMAREGGGVQAVMSDRLALLFKLFPCVDCVVLNACHTEVQAIEIHKHVSCVIGMSQKMGDKSAREFSAAFYGSIFAGGSYARAFELGKLGISSGFDRMKPMLLIREGVNSPGETAAAAGQSSLDTLESFVGSLNWVANHAPSLCRLSPLRQGQLVGAIRQARSKPSSGFCPIEIDVLELASHYVFYCLQNRPSPTFGKMSKRACVRKLTEFSQKGEQIRVGKEKLSILVRESENRLGAKEELSKIIEKLEVHNDI